MDAADPILLLPMASPDSGSKHVNILVRNEGRFIPINREFGSEML